MTVNNKFYLQIQSVPDAFEDVHGVKEQVPDMPPSRESLTEDGPSAVKKNTLSISNQNKNKRQYRKDKKSIKQTNQKKGGGGGQEK